MRAYKSVYLRTFRGFLQSHPRPNFRPLAGNNCNLSERVWDALRMKARSSEEPCTARFRRRS
ncbi:unnamed protein product [Ectocarpus sp. 12 AP-2014]